MLLANIKRKHKSALSIDRRNHETTNVYRGLLSEKKYAFFVS